MRPRARAEWTHGAGAEESRGGPLLGAGEVELDPEPDQPLLACPPERREAGCCSLTWRQPRLLRGFSPAVQARGEALDPPKENVPSEPAENTVQAGEHHDLPETQPRKPRGHLSASNWSAHESKQNTSLS